MAIISIIGRVKGATAICLALSTFACVASEQAAERWLITAEPTSVEFTRTNSTKDRIAPSTFKVVLNDVRVVQGDTSVFPEKFTVELHAHDEKSFGLNGRIYVVLETFDDAINALYWQNIISMACVPDHLVDKRYQDWYFGNEWGDEEKSCRFLRGYEAPAGSDE